MLHNDTRQYIVRALLSITLDATEQHVNENNLKQAALTLQVAKRWLDDLLNNVSRTALLRGDQDLQRRYHAVEDQYILAEVTATGEDLVQMVLAADASRRNQFSFKKFLSSMTDLSSKAFGLIAAFEQHACGSDEIRNRIEPLFCLAMS